MEKNKKIKSFIFSVGRSDFGILKNLIKNLDKEKKIESTLVITGAHHSKIFGYTSREIDKENIRKKIKLKINYNNKNRNQTSKILKELIFKTEKILLKKKPNFVIILGDRFEALAVAFASFNKQIPIVHLCGGSDTKGSLDNKYRYMISDVSDLHLVETKFHKKRLIDYKIDPKKIYIIGAPALENIKYIKFNSKKLLLKKLNIKYEKNQKLVLCAFHPETTITLEENKKNLIKLLNFLNTLPFTLIFTYPNADYGFNEYIKILNQNKIYNDKFYLFENLGIDNYYKLLKKVDVLIGNSSSGIIETSSFKLPTINVGNRQKGRVSSANVINSSFEKNELTKKLKYLMSKSFKKKMSKFDNIYKLQMNSKKIIKLLKKIYI